MRYGVSLPNMGLPGGPAALVRLGQEAEEAGWDGVFLWDSVWSPDWSAHFAGDPERAAMWDPWVVLSVLAARTTRIRLGTLVTPLTRRRPWKIAHETTTLDNLSVGRAVLPVSLGWAPDGAFAKVNEERDRRVRAERLDEALDVVTGLWRGEAFTYSGQHFEVDQLTLPATVQQPRIPIWVVAAWPRARSVERALRWDGMIPATLSPDGKWEGEPTPDDIEAVATRVREVRGSDSYDLVVERTSSRDPAKTKARVAPFADAGATWWLEGVWKFLWQPETSMERMRARIAAGPPEL